MLCSASGPACPTLAAPEAPAHPASPSPRRLCPAAPADVPALAAMYATCVRTPGPGSYAPEQLPAWTDFGADLEGFADYVLKADTWAVAGLGVAPQQGDPAGEEPLGFPGVDDSGELGARLAVQPPPCGSAQFQSHLAG